MRHRIISIVIVVGLLFASLTGCGGGERWRSERAPRLTDAEVKQVLQRAEAAANATPSLLRVDAETGRPHTCRMHVIVMNRSGSVIGRLSMPDAWHGSLSIASAKAYTAMAFSSDHNALTTRSLGALTQPGGPLWNIGNSNRGMFQPGLIEFPGGLPLYKDGRLVGGIGVSGDGVGQDEAVALAASQGHEPEPAIRIDTVTGGDVPYASPSAGTPAP